jgi:hypothetical protein
MSDLKLLEHFRKSALSVLTLEQLKERARLVQAANNRIVQDLWAVNSKITKTVGEEQSRLLIKRDELEKSLRELTAKESITHLLREIKNKERAECGDSVVSPSSPYTL